MIGDLVSNVIVSYKADTADLKKGIRELQGEEKKLAETQLAQANERNKQLESWKSGLLAVGAALGVAGGVAKAIWDNYKEKAEEARLRTAALGVDIDLLGKAALGTKSKMDLLGDAAKLNNGIFKLTSDQMAIVEQAMIGLNRKGHESAEVHKKVLEAVTQLKVEGLKDLGIVLDKTGIQAESAEGQFKLLVKVMDALKEQAKGAGSAQLTMAEQAERAAARTRDAWKDFKEDWLFGSEGHNLLFDDDYRKAWIKDRKQKIVAATMGYDQSKMDSAIGLVGKNAQTAGALASQYPKFGHELEMPEMNIKEEKAKSIEVRDRLAKYKNDIAKITLEIFEQQARQAEAVLRGEVDVVGGRLIGGATAADFMAGRTAYSNSGDEFGRDLMSQVKLKDIGDRRATERWQSQMAGIEATNARQSSKLEAIFGPLTEFDAYKTAFETLNGAVGSAFGAWIDGSASAGQAFKKFIGEALKGVAVQMAMEAVKHGAYAIGDLAFGNFAGAAQHGKAAAAFAAGAVLVGAAAKQMNSGSAGTTGAGAGAPGGGVPAYSGGSQGQGGGSHTTIVYGGPDLNGSSDRQRMLTAKRIVNAAGVAVPGGEMR